MKRDLDLIRSILLRTEACSAGKRLYNIEFNGYDPQTVAEHVYLLKSAGLIEAHIDETYDLEGGDEFAIARLTWQGHEFIQAARDDTLWNTVKESVIKPASSWTFDIVLEALKYEVKRRLGLP